MTQFIDYFLATVFRPAIDNALDDQTPPRGFAAWALRNSSTLRSYYETMLALELELQFSREESNDCNYVATSVPRCEVRSQQFSLLHITGIAALLVVCFIAGLVITRSSVMPPDVVSVTPAPQDLEYLEYPDELLAEFLAFPQYVLPSFALPVDSVVDFASAPLARTLTLLEIAGIAHSDCDPLAAPDI